MRLTVRILMVLIGLLAVMMLSARLVYQGRKGGEEVCDGMTPRDRLYPKYYPMFYRMACTQLRTGLTRDAFEAALEGLRWVNFRIATRNSSP